MSTTISTHLTLQSASEKNRVLNPPPRVALVDLTPNNVGTLRKLNSVLFPVAYSDKFYSQVLEEYLSDFCKLIYYNDLPVGAVCCRVEPDLQQSRVPEPKKTNSQIKTDPTKLYIMTLGVLAPYRCQGLAGTLLHQVLEAARKTHAAAPIAPLPAVESASATTESKKTNLKGKKASASRPADVSHKSNQKDVDQTTDKPTNVQVSPISVAYVHVQLGNDDAKQFYLNRGFKLEGEVQDYYRKIEPRGAWILSKEVTGSA